MLALGTVYDDFQLTDSVEKLCIEEKRKCHLRLQQDFVRVGDGNKNEAPRKRFLDREKVALDSALRKKRQSDFR